MSGKLAYHTVVNALEARAGWTPQARFAAAVKHVISGHLPYERYREAGLLRQRGLTSAGEIEALVADWLATDLNPAVLLISNFQHAISAIAAFNAYNASAQLGVRTRVAFDTQQDGAPLSVTRDATTAESDPEQCKTGALAVLKTLMETIIDNRTQRHPNECTSLTSLAKLLGMEHSPAGEVCRVLDSEGNIPITEIANRLGCHQRTLERRLRASGLTAEAIKQALRLIRSTARLGGNDNLTTIAIEEGFSDLSHMTRAFKQSCGMTPSLCRSLVLDDAKRAIAN